MSDDKRFVTQRDDGAWKVYDKQKEEFLSTSFDSRKQAIDLARVCEEHHRSLQQRHIQA